MDTVTIKNILPWKAENDSKPMIMLLLNSISLSKLACML